MVIAVLPKRIPKHTKHCSSKCTLEICFDISNGPFHGYVTIIVQKDSVGYKEEREKYHEVVTFPKQPFPSLFRIKNDLSLSNVQADVSCNESEDLRFRPTSAVLYCYGYCASG